MGMIKRFRLSLIAVLALVPLRWATLSMASPPDRAAPQQAGQAHPAYLHALSDLRNARANLARRGGDAEMRWDEHRAIETIEQAVTEIKAAAITDGKDLDDHPPLDAREPRAGRLHRALAALRAAREDVSKEEDNAFAQGLRARALRHINDAIAFAEEGLREVEHGSQTEAEPGSQRRWDVTEDFCPTTNPCGVWTYGYARSLGSTPLLVYAGLKRDNALTGWENPAIGTVPSVGKAPRGSVSFPWVVPGQFWEHPGPQGEYSTVRWTAPQTGTYSFSVQFFAGDRGETDGAVLRGTTVLFEHPTSTNPTYSTTLRMAAGDTFDVAVGITGGETIYYGTTPITFVVTER
jgi:hypothetical protein